MDIFKFTRQFVNKFFGGNVAECFIEMNKQRCVDAHGFDDANFF